MPENIVDLVLEPAAQHHVSLVHGDSSATDILSVATTSSMGLNLTSNSLTMDLAIEAAVELLGRERRERKLS